MLSLICLCLGLSLCAGEPSRRHTWVVAVVRQTQDGVATLKVTRKAVSKERIATGVLVDEQGHIVTAAHVVRGVEKLMVSLAGMDLEGEVIHTEDARDLAVVRVRPAKRVAPLRLGQFGEVLTGEPVVTIGAPLGYANTVSVGHISHVGRAIEMPTGVRLRGLLQHTAPISQGSSGGPLLNADGELIGINVALRSDAPHIAFAVGVDAVQKVLVSVRQRAEKKGSGDLP